MKRLSIRSLCLALLCTVVVSVPAAVAAAGADVPALPELTSYPSDPLTPAERDAVVAWVLGHPTVKAHLGDDRIRVLRAGADLPKRSDGSEYRRAMLYVRNYDSGLTTIVDLDLENGELTVGDTEALVQPNRAEIDAGAEIIRADASLREYNENDALVLNGAFYLRSPYDDDPCQQEVCLLFHFVDPGTTSPSRSLRRVLVNMTRGEVMPNDYRYTDIWDTEANSLRAPLLEVK